MKKGKVILLTMLLNVVIPVIFWICMFVLYKTDIVLYFSKPVSTKPIGIIAFIIFPIYLIINFAIHNSIYSKSKNKILLNIKQLIVSFVLFAIIFNVSLQYSSVFKTIVFTFESPDNEITYIIEEINQRNLSSITIKKGDYISAEKQTCIETNFSCVSIEVSWIDNQYFNLKLIPSESKMQNGTKVAYYTFTSSKQFELIEESEYESKQYIKTDILCY